MTSSSSEGEIWEKRRELVSLTTKKMRSRTRYNPTRHNKPHGINQDRIKKFNYIKQRKKLG